jgi:hypothetical protein
MQVLVPTEDAREFISDVRPIIESVELGLADPRFRVRKLTSAEWASVNSQEIKDSYDNARGVFGGPDLEDEDEDDDSYDEDYDDDDDDDDDSDDDDDFGDDDDDSYDADDDYDDDDYFDDDE